MASGVPQVEALCERDADGCSPVLLPILQACSDAAFTLSDALSARYFAHSGDARSSVGA